MTLINCVDWEASCHVTWTNRTTSYIYICHQKCTETEELHFKGQFMLMGLHPSTCRLQISWSHEHMYTPVHQASVPQHDLCVFTSLVHISRNKRVSKANGNGLSDQGSIPGSNMFFLFACPGSHLPHIQWEHGTFPWKLLGQESDHTLRPTSREISRTYRAQWKHPPHFSTLPHGMLLMSSQGFILNAQKYHKCDCYSELHWFKVMLCFWNSMAMVSHCLSEH